MNEWNNTSEFVVWHANHLHVLNCRVTIQIFLDLSRKNILATHNGTILNQEEEKEKKKMKK